MQDAYKLFMRLKLLILPYTQRSIHLNINQTFITIDMGLLYSQPEPPVPYSRCHYKPPHPSMQGGPSTTNCFRLFTCSQTLIKTNPFIFRTIQSYLGRIQSHQGTFSHIQDKSSHVQVKSRHIQDKFSNNKDKSSQTYDKSSNILEKPGIFLKIIHIQQKYRYFLGQSSSHIQDKSSHILKNLDLFSTNSVIFRTSPLIFGTNDAAKPKWQDIRQPVKKQTISHSLRTF